MSAIQTFALCIDCFELHYGIPDSNGVYSRDSGSSNHVDHAVHVFGPPNQYEGSFYQPVRAVLLDLQQGTPISDARIAMFSLACALNAIQPNNGIPVHGVEVPLGAVELFAAKTDRKPSPMVEPEPDDTSDALFDMGAAS